MLELLTDGLMHNVFFSAKGHIYLCSLEVDIILVPTFCTLLIDYS